MKKYKKHLISIVIILLMLVFGLGTQPAPEDIELSIINNSSNNLIIEIFYLDEWDSSIDNKIIIEIEAGKTIALEKIRTRRMFDNPINIISAIIFYNQNGKIIERYGRDYENVSSLVFNLEDRSKRGPRISYYTLEITDELLEGDRDGN